MMSLCLWFFMLMMFMTMFSMNPMKMIYTMMIMMSMVSMMLTTQMSSPWFSAVMYLLFMGGILISFMMISAMMPNEKSLSMNKMAVITFPIAAMASYSSQEQMINILPLKNEMTMNSNLMFLSAVMVTYFLTFVTVISQYKHPLRTLMC